ncbi:transcriptional regulator [Streptococcus macedonicus]|uniref:Helix-turn-helix transcriptional regulator n=2 Tax=Streptococcus TaxID=1301 RepID=A0AAW6YIK2_9STRE|nr:MULTISPECIES: helix-turn-helix transcriptional regulator [Streptococcus]MDK7292431.1 helix-turn-helix transcriptional regulator [Streptococcus pasteurianus]MDK7292478.1 helix-turn-helix transcriptional regulator [Streptococcus pasteurianus]PLA54567.1 transcriptional regulator [Streptococcus macedonicus]
MQIKLYELRKQAGLTQAQMAEKLNISKTTYRSKELGRTDFKSTEMFLIADILEKDIHEIFLPKKTTIRG